MEEECKLEAQVLPSPAMIHDVEEGEISDSTTSLVEEITKEDFNKPDQPALSGATPDIQAADPLPKAIVVNPENNSISTTNNPYNNSYLNYNNNNNCSNNSTNPNGNRGSQQNRVWTMRDLYEYQYSRDYSRRGHNLAWASWASAVKNQPFPKPSDDFIIMDVPKSTADDASLKPDGSLESSPSSTGGENEAAKVVVEMDRDKIEGLDEKEDGELEEGEIDLESDVVNYDGGQFKSIDAKVAELESRANSILKGLENVEGEYAEKSFDEVYSMVENLFESLVEFADEICFTKKDDIIKLIFTAFQSLKTVFASMSRNQKDHKGESLKKFVASLMTLKHPFLSSEQLREMETLVSSMSYSTISTSSEGIKRNNEMPVVDGFAKNSVDICLESSLSDLIDESVEPVPMEISDLSEADDTVENLGVPEVSSRYKGLSLPLIDLHKDHDADSLPSPTREVPSNLPVDKTLGIVRGILKPEWPIPRVSIEMGSISLHPYETEAVKAVSTYQQKFGRSSFLMTDRLPSPTPSEDGDAADGDISGEVSSSLRNVNPVSASAGEQPVSSVTPKRVDLSGQVLRSAWSSAPVSVGQNHQANPSLTRSRDPRLRLVNSDDICDSFLRSEPKTEPAWGLSGSRKHKTVEEPLLCRPALKKSRNEPIESRVVHNAQNVSGAGLWLDSGGTVGMQMAPRNQEFVNGPPKTGNTVGLVSSSNIAPNLMVNVSDNIPGVITKKDNIPGVVSGTTTSLHSLLKEIAVNPSIWMNILKMEQKKSAAPTINTLHHPSLNSVLGSVPLMHSVSPKPSIVMPRSSGPSQVPTVASPAEESGIMRMKPRDPRRVLHSTPQNGESVGGHSLGKATTLSGPGRGSSLVEQRHEDQVDKKSIPTTSGPDITRQFTKNLKNISDLVSVTQSTLLQSSIPQTATSEPAQAIQGRLDKRAASDFSQAVAGLCSKEASAVSSQPQNNWGDVEHLFDGFDDQQKAAIHRERARRMEEQRKMFAARKLCLVLDLDHTLLNSAKFVEVDPVHNEILRKKEEEDREKPQRQLFCFPHMSMWTKLRPGIWNFLDKASKLYELHLYTMGNKLYATEMAKLLDPKGDLFAGRVISRGDDGDPFDGDERVPKSKDLEGVLGMESAVVIIDDSVRVWPHNRLNLIVVERYIYFPCSRRQFGLSGPSLLEIDHDERQEDGTLASSLAVIEKIHFEFFQHQSLHEADVRNILASEQRKILAGCRILFSRVIPVGEAKPHLHPLWQTAEQFGAVCTNSIDEQVTHVVANSLGTDKVNWALCTGRFVVHPGWVEASALLYRRANEHDFAIK